MSQIQSIEQHKVNAAAPACTCTDGKFAANWREGFYQGGKILHALGNSGAVEISSIRSAIPERSLVPGPLNTGSLISIEAESKLKGRNWGTALDTRSDGSDDPDDWAVLPGVGRSKTFPSEKMSRVVDAESFIEKNRVNLRKYEALDVNGVSLTSLSIGGYEVDMGKAAQKASLVAPLPRAKLPLIFIDHDMNFLHHFFQGLDRLIGRDVVLEIVQRTKFYNTGELILLPLIEKMMASGWEKTDDNLTVFVKATIIATFEPDPRYEPNDPHRGLVVAANLYGFKYIECGVELKEAGLQMWLTRNYSRYEDLYFDTFKDSGVPAFAMDGIQIRYEKPMNSGSKEDSPVPVLNPLPSREVVSNYLNSQEPYPDYARRPRRRRHSPPKPTTLGTFLFGPRAN